MSSIRFFLKSRASLLNCLCKWIRISVIGKSLSIDSRYLQCHLFSHKDDNSANFLSNENKISSPYHFRFCHTKNRYEKRAAENSHQKKISFCFFQNLMLSMNPFDFTFKKIKLLFFFFQFLIVNEVPLQHI